MNETPVAKAGGTGGATGEETTTRMAQDGRASTASKDDFHAELYQNWFRLADSDGDGRVTGADAVGFFERSGLPREQLAKVWAFADNSRRGYLDLDAFVRALELVSMFQSQGNITLSQYDEKKRQGGGIDPPMLEGLPTQVGPPPGASTPAEPFTPYYGTMGSRDTPDVSKSHAGPFSTFHERHVGTTLPVSSKKLPSPREERKRGPMTAKDVTSITDGLGKCTLKRLGLWRRCTSLGHFFSPMLNEGDFEAKPSVLLLGQYSTGKTTFIKYLLGRDYPGLHIGPEPTTDRFVVVMHGPDDRPRCDLILLLFDPHKLDISDEFKHVISTLKGHDDKVRIVLNKADQVDQQQLMRVYGALMWSLGKVFQSPEVCRVYIGSFNANAPIREDVNPTCKPLFEKEQEDLLHDLYDIPARSCDRKINEFVKRVRAAKIHFLVMGHLRKQIPYFGQKKAQAKLLARLQEEFIPRQREYHLHPGDFPDVERYREILSAFDISKFPKLDKNVMRQIEEVLTTDIPNLVREMGNPFQK
eukprot:jgi/Picre1/34795/NNA_002261.t1